MQKLSDEHLVAAIERGRTAALDELYARYGQKLYAFCRHTTMNPPTQVIEDLVQDVFLRVLRFAASFDPEKASFRTWLFIIARNRCIDHSRRPASASFVPLEANPTPEHQSQTLPLAEILPDLVEDSDVLVMQRALHQAISDCIAQLPNEEERQALLLYYFAGKVYREIASVLESSLSTAKNRVHQAVNNIKTCLQAAGFDSW